MKGWCWPCRRAALLVVVLSAIAVAQFWASGSSAASTAPGTGDKPSEGSLLSSASGILSEPDSIAELRASAPTAWVQMMAEDFEGTWPTGLWSVSGNPTWDDDDFKPHWDQWSAWCANGGTSGLDPEYNDYPNNMDAWAKYGPFDLSDAVDAMVIFYYWYETEQNWDWLGLYASEDGVNYYLIVEYSGSTGGSWLDDVHHLTAVPGLGDLTGDPTVWIAFRFRSDGSATDQGAFIDDVSLWKDTCSVPATPVLITPPDEWETCNTTPTMGWSDVSGATYYQIQVDDSDTFGSPIIDTTTVESYYTPGTQLPPGNWFWHVRACNDCGCGSWSVTWDYYILTTPGTPSLLSPGNGSSTCDTTPTMDWSSVSGADYYQIQVDDSDMFGSPVIDTTTVNSDYTPGTALAPGYWYWHVRACNDCGCGSWSVTWGYNILSTPTAPTLLSPGNGSSTCDTTPTFDWSTVSGATSYRIQVDNNSDFSSPEIDTTTTNSDYTPGTALAPNTYYWRVRASNSCGNGTWSAVWHFDLSSECHFVYLPMVMRSY